MKKFFSFFVLGLILALFFIPLGRHANIVYAQDAPTPTPSYDPLAEPYVPENPSEYELGHNWYWHNCMTCHGDVGQGLTDEFRAIWPEDHQNCWDHGCHGGRRDDEGFPIPTIVPALVNEEKLAQFSSQQALFEFLKSTHPPQDPGCLEDEQYDAIVKYVFSMNNRPLDLPTPVPTITPTTIPTPVSEAVPETQPPQKANSTIYIGLSILVVFVALWIVSTKLPRS